MKKLVIVSLILGALGYTLYANNESKMKVENKTEQSSHKMNDNNMGHHSHNTSFYENEKFAFNKKLLLPPVLKGEVINGVRNFNIETTIGEFEFLDGKKTETYGYNGSLLGPILSLNAKERTKINIKNNLLEETTVHWHGAIVSQNVDGVHNSDILPEEEKSVEFTLNQPASTLWFHPHTMHKTASQVYKGLAGLIYLEDEESKNLNIPKEYGVNDFPLIIQDKKLSAEGELEYKTTHMEKIHGKSGGYLIINGIISPYLDIQNGVTRLRLVNGSNATNFNIDLDGKEFYQIASDGGFLNAPVELKELKLSPGERAELLISSKDFNDKEYLYINGTKALELRKTKERTLNIIPKTLVKVSEVEKDLDKLNTRNFVLKTNSKSNLINGSEFDMDRLDFEVKKGTKEIWNITNNEGMMDMPHPFHVHGAQFRVIERNGEVPPLNEQGYKDTVNINPGENVKILVEYKTDGVTVYHCHILEHEEMGMMGQFIIEE